ncbi:MAG: DUF2268 domain-containing putative Zn-dependent protease [Chloroflexota bacterium]|nr:DUF2268 domain-containing putative Zn-dependent protease [Chloroflexota bacterium]
MSVTAIPAYRVVKKFVRELDGLPADSALESLWHQLRSYVNHLLNGAGVVFADLGQRLAISQIGDPDLSKLSLALTGLDDGNPKVLAEETLQRCTQLLPQPDLAAQLIILPGDEQSNVLNMQMNGVMGVTLGTHSTLVFIWPSGSWQSSLAYTIAHEYVHLVRNCVFPKTASGGKIIFEQTGEPETLLDAMVTEGIADAFALQLYPNAQALSQLALSTADQLSTWPKIRRRLHNSDMVDIRRFLVGDNDRIPLWIGYATGYSIVRQYMNQHPTIYPNALVRMSARTIFESLEHGFEFTENR